MLVCDADAVYNIIKLIMEENNGQRKTAAALRGF